MTTTSVIHDFDAPDRPYDRHRDSGKPTAARATAQARLTPFTGDAAKTLLHPPNRFVMLRRHTIALFVCVSCFACGFGSTSAWAGTNASGQPNDTVVAHAQSLPAHLSAYGQVQPTALVNVRVVDAGTLSGLRVLPGGTATAGEPLARVTGTRMRSLLTQRETAVRSAQARLDAATRALAIARRQLAAQLSTRQAVDTAASELAAARAAAQTAQAELAATRDFEVLKAPASGAVVAVKAADGEEVSAGETILTIQPAGPLWVSAEYYGNDGATLRVGMTGRFEPADGGAAVPVKVATIAPAIGPDGGRQVGLVAAAQAAWTSGQWGTVTLEGPAASLVMVPSAALILDRGQWWVLVRTARGVEPTRVVPGPAHGWETGIVSGLKPGARVVAQDAYLEYHRGIAQSYQPPD